MRSGKIAQLAGVTVRTLRHYRTIGLLHEPPRGDNGYCEYSIDDLIRLLRIKQLASLGFSLEDIGGMLASLDADDGSKAAELLDELDRELVEQIEQLEKKRQTLALIRSQQLDADVPTRLASVIGMLKEYGLPEDAMKSERSVMLLAGAMLSESDLDDTEAAYQDLVDRGLIDDYIKLNDWILELSDDATEAEKSAVVEKMVAVVKPVFDRIDTSSWAEEPTEAELQAESIFSQYQEQQLTPVQKEVTDRAIAALREFALGKAATSSSEDGCNLD